MKFVGYSTHYKIQKAEAKQGSLLSNLITKVDKNPALSPIQL